MRTFLKIVLLLILTVVILAGGLYWWFTHQTEQIPVTEALLETWFEKDAVRPDFVAVEREDCADTNPLNNAYFGALHVHTAVSSDAYGFGVSKLPDDFYNFARGGEIELRLQNETGPVPSLRLDKPLDFAAVTDHAGNMGEQALCLDPSFEGSNGLICKVLRGEWTLPVDPSLDGIVRMLALIGLQRGRPEILCGKNGDRCLQRATEMWALNQQAAERWYDRSANCEFSTFVGYEYTLATKGANLHRNIIFKNATVPPTPISARDVKQPELMWQWLDEYCRESGTGCDALSIPHNSNWSSGRMFYPYTLRDLPREEQIKQASLRAKYERLVETMQVKGDSECRNGLNSVIGGTDELCNFEKLRPPEEVFEDCGEEQGSGGMRLAGCLSQYSYSRYALAAGLEDEQKLGVNPFKFGLIAATDSHNATGGAVAENKYLGATGTDRSIARRASKPFDVPGGIAKGSPVQYNPGGIAGVYAPQNTREDLFEAMQRRETFGTSGPRIQPRFFGGWDIDEQLCEQNNMLEAAYASAVPMGSDLPNNAGEAATPGFLLSANKDPAADATALQAIQIIKSWSDANGETHQAVYDVAGDRNNGANVDTNTCQRSGPGFTRLCAVWQDPDFNPAVSAAYYARVVENPSCRWLAYDCMNAKADQRPESCDDPLYRKSIQERAWTSPIWYSAEGDANLE
ncbi:MAG: DUF3604 domain-containing protein [Pseudomonadales bacterium]